MGFGFTFTVYDTQLMTAEICLWFAFATKTIKHNIQYGNIHKMLPLTHKDHRSVAYRIKSKLNDWKRLIFSDRNSRNLFLFLLLNLSFAFVELFYGIATNSLGEFGVFYAFFLSKNTELISICIHRSHIGFISYVLRLHRTFGWPSRIGNNEMESKR